jgi:hypothetical protein
MFHLSGCVQQPGYHTMWTTSAEPVLQSSGMNKSSTNVLFATRFSTQNLIHRSIPSYHSWLLSLEQPYELKSSLVLNQQKFPVTSVLGPSKALC